MRVLQDIYAKPAIVVFLFAAWCGGTPVGTFDRDAENLRSGQSKLSYADPRHLADAHRIARLLARRHGASEEKWPLFVEPAEELIKHSQSWYE